MKAQRGMAISSQLVRMPEEMRDPPVDRKRIGTPAKKAKTMPMPERTNATGYPEKMPATSATSMASGQANSIMVFGRALVGFRGEQEAQGLCHARQGGDAQQPEADRDQHFDEPAIHQTAIGGTLAGGERGRGEYPGVPGDDGAEWKKKDDVAEKRQAQACPLRQARHEHVDIHMLFVSQG